MRAVWNDVRTFFLEDPEGIQLAEKLAGILREAQALESRAA